MPRIQSEKSLPWDVVEKAINQEVGWLKEIIPISYHKKNDICEDCIRRRLAILILSGRIKAKDIKSSDSLWYVDPERMSPLANARKLHGKEWHSRTMGLIEHYFKSLGYDTVEEPKLSMGRADLGVYKNGEQNLFVEVGTVSLPKLLFNLESMEGSDFLLVIGDDRAVEFSVVKADYKTYSV